MRRSEYDDLSLEEREDYLVREYMSRDRSCKTREDVENLFDKEYDLSDQLEEAMNILEELDEEEREYWENRPSYEEEIGFIPHLDGARF